MGSLSYLRLFCAWNNISCAGPVAGHLLKLNTTATTSRTWLTSHAHCWHQHTPTVTRRNSRLPVQKQPRYFPHYLPLKAEAVDDQSVSHLCDVYLHVGVRLVKMTLSLPCNWSLQIILNPIKAFLNPSHEVRQNFFLIMLTARIASESSRKTKNEVRLLVGITFLSVNCILIFSINQFKRYQPAKHSVI